MNTPMIFAQAAAPAAPTVQAAAPSAPAPVTATEVQPRRRPSRSRAAS